MKPMPFAFFRGRIVPLEEAKVSLASHSLQYGSTCFTGMRAQVQDGSIRLFRLRAHHTRLLESARMLGWKWDLSFEAFSAAIRALIEANEPKSDVYIRPFLLTESEELRLDYTSLTFDLAIYLVPFGALFDPDRGLRLKISSWERLSDNAIPTKAKAGGSYLNSCLAHTDAKRDGYDDASLLNREGNIAELSGANLLLFSRGRLLMPPAGKDVLDGITLRSILEILQSEEILVEETPIDRSMLLSADEIVVTGTAAQVQFVASIDGQEIGKEPGIITTLLRKRMKQIIEQKDPLFSHWITEINQGRTR